VPAAGSGSASAPASGSGPAFASASGSGSAPASASASASASPSQPLRRAPPAGPQSGRLSGLSGTESLPSEYMWSELRKGARVRLYVLGDS